MTETTAITTRPAVPASVSHARAGWTKREAGLIAQSLAPTLDETGLRVYQEFVRATGLNPFSRQVYAWMDKGKLSIQVSIQGWRLIAERTGEFMGSDPIEYANEKGQWSQLWLSDSPPVAARATVYRENRKPTSFVALWREFSRPGKRGIKGRDGGTFDKLTPWDEKPAHMLGVRAEAHALERAFPEAFGAMNQSLKDAGSPSVEAVTEDEIAGVVTSTEIVDEATGEILEEPAAQVTEDDETRFAKLVDLCLAAGLKPVDLTRYMGIKGGHEVRWDALSVGAWLDANGVTTLSNLIEDVLVSRA